MRRDIVHMGAGSLSYAIREIVQVAHRFRDLGMEITWENIGDPIQKGEVVEPWIRDILRYIVEQDLAWGYCDTAGVPKTREFLAEEINKRGGAKVTPNDVVFFNGLGDAVSKIYGLLKREARVIGPTPAYSTHSSAEGSHSGYEHLTYELDPHHGWMPDLDDLRLKVRYNDSVAGILLINPNNPTGTVYPREILEGVVEIARQFGLFLICDEIYAHIVYAGAKSLHLSQVIGDVPGIVMRGISKEYPWPGARCGWIEVLNRDQDATFNTYATSLLAAKRLEVCSTTMPQLTIPPVYGDTRYATHLRKRAEMFERRAKEALDALAGISGLIVSPPRGAFYLTVMFEDGLLNDRQTLKIDSPKVRHMVEEMTRTGPLDQRFVYYLMGATGICVVPLTGFYSRHHGFRMTLLETDERKRHWIFNTLAQAIREYLGS